MSGVCSSIGPGDAFVSGMLNYIDCQAQNLGELGYRALASGLSSFSPLLTIALTIFVAILGYRLLIGQPPKSNELAFTALKVGFVLMLATSWSAFKPLVYDVTMRGPADLVQAIGTPSAIPGSDGALVSRLQGLDALMSELLVRGEGQPQVAQGQAYGNGGSGWVPFDANRNAEMMSQSRTAYLFATIGGFALVRFAAGFLLALAPLFALFLLFERSRGLFESWLKGLLATILGSAAISIVLGLQLAFMEPWVAEILTVRRVGIGTPSIPVELLVTALVFLFAQIGLLFIIARLVFRANPNVIVHMAEQMWRQMPASISSTSNALISSSSVSNTENRSRATLIADSVAAADKRERTARAAPSQNATSTRVLTRETRGAAAVREGVVQVQTGGFGQTAMPRSRSRVSATARRRDGF